MGHFFVFLTIAGSAAPVLASSPPESARLVLSVPVDSYLRPKPSVRGAPRSERGAYPTDRPQVSVDDATRPPGILWNPSSTSLVKVVPAKVRYSVKF